MRQFVAERADRIGHVRADHDGAAAGHRDAGSPRRGSATGELTHASLIGNDDKSKGPVLAPSQPGPSGRRIRHFGESSGERKLCGPGDGSHLAHADDARIALQGDRD